MRLPELRFFHNGDGEIDISLPALPPSAAMTETQWQLSEAEWRAAHSHCAFPK